MLEKTLERAGNLYVKAYGGQSYKWVAPGHVGVPDRMYVMPGGKVVFVEFKRPGIKDGRSAPQKKEFDRLTKLGVRVWLINSKEDLRQRLQELADEV